VRVGIVANREDPEAGFVGERFDELGASFVRRRRSEPDLLAGLERDVDVIVLLGSDWSVYDPVVATEIEAERDLVRRATDVGCPTLGICFGGQLVASALGCAVERAPLGEIGWTSIDSDDPELFGHGPWFQFHLDRWIPTDAHPARAQSALAAQAIVDRRTLGVQFHPEVTADVVERWVRASPTQVASVGGSVEAILAETSAHIDQARRQSHRFVDAFLERVASTPLD
jgi:GMP synthase-like glutamine amidotransferase